MDSFLRSNFFEKAFKQIPQPAILLATESSGCHIESANDAFCQLGNFSPEKMLRAQVASILERLPCFKEHSDSIREFLSSLAVRDEDSGVFTRLIHQVKLSSFPLGAQQGCKIFLLTLQHEAVSDEQLRSLEESLISLKSSNANLEQFAYVASHDLQEPLRKLKAFGDILQSRFADGLGEEGSDLIRRMQSAAGRMSVLMDDLLNYSRMSLSPAELNVIDANQVLDGVILDLEASIQRHQAIIFHERLFPVAAHPTQLGQVFLNLIGNALKFHREGVPPQINISTTLQQGRETGFLLRQEDADKMFQVISITDNGIGFQNEERELIFKEFQRLNNRSLFPGSGLGLAIVKKVVEHHHGYIIADSTPGEGSTFTLILPAVAQ